MFKAPSTPIQPVLVPPGTEKAELITGGKIIWNSGSGDEIHGRGTIFWHHGGEYTIHRTFPDAPYRCLVFDFDVSETERVFPRLGFWRASSTPEQLAADLLGMLNRTPPVPAELTTAAAIGAFAWQMRCGEPIRERHPRALREACALLGSDLSRDRGIGELAASSGVSRTQLFRLFREYLGCTPHRYLLRLRIDNARTLLLSRPDLPIKLVAEICGFSTLEVFYRQFRKLTGSAPGAFRATDGERPA